ncbi:MAG: tetratricopeptide repeat protein [Bacillota bacterium]
MELLRKVGMDKGTDFLREGVKALSQDNTGEDEDSLRLVPKPSKSLTKLQLSLREALAAEPRQDTVVAKALERLLDHPEVEEVHDVPQFLYELANCYTAMGQFDRAIKTIERILARRWIGRPDGRCLIGRVLLTAGRKPEADALYAAIKADGPNDIYLYDTLGRITPRPETTNQPCGGWRMALNSPFGPEIPRAWPTTSSAAAVKAWPLSGATRTGFRSGPGIS